MNTLGQCIPRTFTRLCVHVCEDGSYWFAFQLDLWLMQGLLLGFIVGSMWCQAMVVSWLKGAKLCWDKSLQLLQWMVLYRKQHMLWSVMPIAMVDPQVLLGKYQIDCRGRYVFSLRSCTQAQWTMAKTGTGEDMSALQMGLRRIWWISHNRGGWSLDLQCYECMLKHIQILSWCLIQCLYIWVWTCYVVNLPHLS